MRKFNSLTFPIILTLLSFCSISQLEITQDARSNTKKIVCYYRLEKKNSTGLTPDKLDLDLCTHIIVGFVGVNNSTVSYDYTDIPGYLAVTSLKQKKPNLKVMISIGGGGSKGSFTEAVSSESNRKKFIDSIYDFCEKINADGVDLDWEFPVWRSNIFKRNRADKKNLILFLMEFKRRTEYEDPDTRLLISVAVAGPKAIVGIAYDIPNLSKYADFVNLMSYDYNDYTFYTPYVAHNAPLFKRKLEFSYLGTLNTNWSANYFISNGLDKSKLMVGIPFYAHTYKLLSSKLTAPGSFATSGSSGLSYSTMCDFLKNGGTRKFDDQAKVPYAFKGKDWISYEDPESAKIKSNWIKQNDYGGVMIFSLSNDDWEGTCDGKTKFPLLKIIKNIIET